MNPIKIFGGVLVALGFIFRAISIAHHNQKAKTLPETPTARRRFEASKNWAWRVDVAFIVIGFYLIIRA